MSVRIAQKSHLPKAGFLVNQGFDLLPPNLLATRPPAVFFEESETSKTIHHFERWCAIHLFVRTSRRSRVRLPPFNISSWNARMSNLGPSSFRARSRNSRNLSCPIL